MLKIRVDTRAATIQFDKVLSEIRRTEESVVRQEARGLAVGMARATQPFGLSEGDADKFSARVEADVARVYIDPGAIWSEIVAIDPAFANATWAEYKRGDWNKVRELLQRSGNPRLQRLQISGRIDPSYHRRARNRTRRRAVPNRWPGDVIMTNDRARQTFARKKVRNVGRAASGWATAGRDMKGRMKGLPKWKAYARHKSPGSGTVRTRRTGTIAELRNSVPWTKNILSPSAKAKAEQIAAEKFEKALKTSQKKAYATARRTARRAA